MSRITATSTPRDRPRPALEPPAPASSLLAAPLRSAASLCSELERRWRLHRTVRRYENKLRALRLVSVPPFRADILDTMAMSAGWLSLYEAREREAQSWAATACILRAVAASERGCVLTSMDLPGRDSVTGTAARPLWQALACARDRAARAGFQAELCASYITEPGVLVLDDIAATELAIAVPPCPAHGWRGCLCSGPPDFRAAPELTAPENRHA